MMDLRLEELMLESRQVERERALTRVMRLREAKVGVGGTVMARRWFAARLIALGSRVAPPEGAGECSRATTWDGRLPAT